MTGFLFRVLYQSLTRVSLFMFAVPKPIQDRITFQHMNVAVPVLFLQYLEILFSYFFARVLSFKLRRVCLVIVSFCFVVNNVEQFGFGGH